MDGRLMDDNPILQGCDCIVSKKNIEILWKYDIFVLGESLIMTRGKASDFDLGLKKAMAALGCSISSMFTLVMGIPGKYNLFPDV